MIDHDSTPGPSSRTSLPRVAPEPARCRAARSAAEPRREASRASRSDAAGRHAGSGGSAAGFPSRAKCEHLQPVGAFKIRGRLHRRFPDSAADLRARGVITYSSGNHGQAVAFAARLLGTQAVVVMPERAPAIKVDGVTAAGR